MENKDLKNSFSHPAVIITILILVFIGGYFLLNKNSESPQQKEINTLKTEIENLKNSKTETTQNPSINQPTAKAKSLADIIAQWRKSTAYVECYWTNPYTHEVNFKQSGSGLLVLFDYSPTVITNRHIADNPQYGTPQECDVEFPDDKYFYYFILTKDVPAYNIAPTIQVPALSAHGKIEFATDGSDVAYLSGFKMSGVAGANELPPLSLQERARSGRLACTLDPDIGEPLVILGYPSYGSGAGTIVSVFSHLEITATEGIVSGKDGNYYTTSAKIEHGNSGGLAVDKTNNCYLGIPTLSYTGEIESLGRILPASYIFKY